MPRIDPIQLLNCLSVLLSPNGGIKSREEVQRLASLMIKYSKKLVSKCIYIQILKCTETDLLGLFMGSGGWRLVHMWLTESIVAKNWPLVRELLELLLLCPVDIERLKTNNCPKLVKELSKDGNHYEIRALASKLVEQWLKTVKGENVVPVHVSDISQIVSDAKTEFNSDNVKSDFIFEPEVAVIIPDNEGGVGNELQKEKNIDDQKHNEVVEKGKEDSEALPVLKISLKDGKQIVSQVDESEIRTDDLIDKDKSKEKQKSKNREKSHDRNSSSASSKSSSSKHSEKSHSSSDKYKSSSTHKSSSSSRHSSKDRRKEKEKSHSTKSKSSDSDSKRSSNSSSRSKEDKKSKTSSDREKAKEKNVKDDNNEKKDGIKSQSEKLDDKRQSPSIHKLGKIPKLSDTRKEKPSLSIEIRKPDAPKPKTVKTFHSKFRKHGLEEEVKPPPSRASLLNKKVPPVITPTISIPKRSSPAHNESPPEKKIKAAETLEKPTTIDKPGAIKLIPPKPKPMLLLESDMFMDALNASATSKKEPKKRKRRTSGSKDGHPGEGSPQHTPTTVVSPSAESKSVPPRFYQDTLETEDNKEKVNEKSSDSNDNSEIDNQETKPEVIMEVEEPHTLTVNGLKGVLCYHKRKGPKKSIRWKSDSELEEVQYFELDETERVNVTKTFTDMKYLERIHERDNFQKGRNISTDDVMEEKTNWKPLIMIQLEGQIEVEYGKNSKEKDIQAVKQKGTLQPLYFHKSMIPDSPHEPDPEVHAYNEPTVIPLEDVTGNLDNVSDFRNMPWPEPKGNAPPPTANMNMQTNIFPGNMAQFPNAFPGAQFPGMPGFQGPMVPGDWQNSVPPPIMANGMQGPGIPIGMLPGSIPPSNMPPGMMVPPEEVMMNEMFGNPNPMFTIPPEGFNMQNIQNMYPIDFNMAGPQVPGMPGGPEGFPGAGNFRGAMRGRGAGGHWRGKGPGNWESPQRGRGGHNRASRSKPVCIYFQRKGSCRQGDSCGFLHPGVNCPY